MIVKPTLPKRYLPHSVARARLPAITYRLPPASIYFPPVTQMRGSFSNAPRTKRYPDEITSGCLYRSSQPGNRHFDLRVRLCQGNPRSGCFLSNRSLQRYFDLCSSIPVAGEAVAFAITIQARLVQTLLRISLPLCEFHEGICKRCSGRRGLLLNSAYDLDMGCRAINSSNGPFNCPCDHLLQASALVNRPVIRRIDSRWYVETQVHRHQACWTG